MAAHPATSRFLLPIMLLGLIPAFAQTPAPTEGPAASAASPSPSGQPWLSIPAQPNSSDFRAASWGMTQAEAIATESAEPSATWSSNGETIVHFEPGVLPDSSAGAIYIFAGDPLARAKYLYEGKHAEYNDHIVDYRAIQTHLLEQLGQPTFQKSIWADDSLQEERIAYLEQDRALPMDILPSDVFAGQAISVSQLTLYSYWCTPRTKIYHTLSGMDGKITHQIEYVSRRHEALEYQVRRESLGADQAGPAPQASCG